MLKAYIYACVLRGILGRMLIDIFLFRKEKSYYFNKASYIANFSKILRHFGNFFI